MKTKSLPPSQTEKPTRRKTPTATTKKEPRTRTPKAMALSQFVIRTERIGPSLPKADAPNPQSLHDFYQAYIRPTMQDMKEHLHVILLDGRLKTVGFHLVSMGKLNGAEAHPREILRPALLAGAYGFCLAHNHPSGDPTPSVPDHELTECIEEAADLMGLTFLDHLIVADGDHPHRPYFSFRQEQMLGADSPRHRSLAADRSAQGDNAPAVTLTTGHAGACITLTASPEQSDEIEAQALAAGSIVSEFVAAAIFGKSYQWAAEPECRVFRFVLTLSQLAKLEARAHQVGRCIPDMVANALASFAPDALNVIRIFSGHSRQA